MLSIDDSSAWHHRNSTRTLCNSTGPCASSAYLPLVSSSQLNRFRLLHLESPGRVMKPTYTDHNLSSHVEHISQFAYMNIFIFIHSSRLLYMNIYIQTHMQSSTSVYVNIHMYSILNICAYEHISMHIHTEYIHTYVGIYTAILNS